MIDTDDNRLEVAKKFGATQVINNSVVSAIEKIMMHIEGGHSVFEIAEEVGLDYWMVREYVEKFRAKGFVVPLSSHPKRKRRKIEM